MTRRRIQRLLAGDIGAVKRWLGATALAVSAALLQPSCGQAAIPSSDDQGASSTAGGSVQPRLAAGAIQFNRDIRPILSDNCFHCHGFEPTKRKANLRLDSPEGATALNKDGLPALKPGDLQNSELWRRVNSAEPKVHMPPPDSGKSLTPEQIAQLSKWIQQGAPYQKHWAFEPPQRPAVPMVKKDDWPQNDIDRFILATLESKQLTPAKEAARETLVRRLTLDLNGLSPTLEEVDAFLADPAPGAYERLVDRLLASPRYGEHMGRYWLDVARYGDTHGLHFDNERSVWPYRDWVVKAFNQNLPYDEFTIWQLAGDLLQNATREQRVASGFNRCNVSTSEGGAIDEEFQVRYAVDRVETTSAAFMGLTMGCAVCHDHKLDPITQKEFYQVFAIFNNISEQAMDKNALLPPPTMQLPSPEQERQSKELNARVTELEKRSCEATAKLSYTDPATVTKHSKPQTNETVWIEDDFPRGAALSVNDGNPLNQFITAAEGPVFSGHRSIQRRGQGLHQVFFPNCSEPLALGVRAKLFAYVYLDPKDPPKAIMLQWHTDGWNQRANWGDPDAILYGANGTTQKLLMGALPEVGKWVRLEVEAEKLGLRPGAKITGLAFTQFDGNAYWDRTGLMSTTNPAHDPSLSLIAWEKSERKLGAKSSASPEIQDLLKKDPAKREDAEREKLQKYFLVNVYAGAPAALAPLRDELKSFRAKQEALEKEIPSTMISKELEKPRPAWVLVRGQYDKHGDPVGPGVPSVLPPLPRSDVTNRLTFARWLVDPKHPLTARVTVNRFWQQFFGTGLVKTAEDFGSKGEWPSHPDLLDWLATDFIASKWDVKRLVRNLVTSSTYRQDSRVTPELQKRDPENRLLARGARHRLDAEELRDNALFVSGLLNPKMGGRGVRPYQPSGIWEAVGYTTSNTAKYTQDHGDALYRRSLYLFWKRTAPPPMMTTFDAPSREQCRARRERTNTPLQALTTMNDVTYFEAARQLGYRMLRNGGATDADRLRYGFRLLTARAPEAAEQAVLSDNLQAQRARYATDANAARKAISVGESPVPGDVPPVELAAYTMVANLLLNLDEAITKN